FGMRWFWLLSKANFISQLCWFISAQVLRVLNSIRTVLRLSTLAARNFARARTHSVLCARVVVSDGRGLGRLLDLVELDLLCQRVAVEPQTFGRPGEVAVLAAEVLGNEGLFEVAEGFGKENALVDHLDTEALEPLFQSRGPFG